MSGSAGLIWISLTRRGSVAYAHALLAAMQPAPLEAWISAEAAELLPEAFNSQLKLRRITTFSGKWSAAFASLYRLPALCLELRRMKREQAGIEIVFPVYHIWNIPLLIWANWLGIPVQAIVHDAAVHPGDSAPGYACYLRLLRKKAHRLLFLSEYTRSTLGLQADPRTKVSLHPAFGDAQAVSARDLVLPLRLLFIGRLLPYKGADLLLQSLSLLPEANWASCTIAGGGALPALPAAIRARISLRNEWIPETEFAKLFDSHDLLLLPYREASQSGIAAWGQGHGLPVLATRLGGLPEQLEGRGGLLCEPEAEAIAAAVSAICADPAGYNKLSREGSDFARAHSWRRHAADFFEK